MCTCFFFFFETALLKYNTHTIQFTYLKCAGQCFFSVSAGLDCCHHNLILECFCPSIEAVVLL